MEASTRSVAMKFLTLSLTALLVHLPTGQAGCPADYFLLGCFADSDTNRLMPHAYVEAHEQSMSTKLCYYICNDGINTHFGTQYSQECWCAIDPDLTKNGPEQEHGECSMLCAGTTSDDHCGGFFKMLAYEITTYQGCHPEPSDGLIEQAHVGLSTSEDEQVIGHPWDYQEKYDTTRFFTPNQGQHSSLSNGVPAGSCDVDDDHKKLLSQMDVWHDSALIKKAPRVFCGIYTHQPNHATKVKAIKETWASHCDGYVAFSDSVDLELNTFKIKHEGPEEYNNMWQKSRAIWKYISFHYKNDFDWFILGGDDLFVIMENLRKYLLSDEIKSSAGGLKNGGTNPMYLGRRIRPFGENHRTFNHGGPSYVLNRASLITLASHLDDDACHPHAKKSSEDVLVAGCLLKNGVDAFDTRDAFGRERFHLFTPAGHLRLQEEAENGDDPWFVVQSIDFKFGRECCSRDSVSFHGVDEQLMRRLYHILYSCPRDPVRWMAQG